MFWSCACIQVWSHIEWYNLFSVSYRNEPSHRNAVQRLLILAEWTLLKEHIAQRETTKISIPYAKPVTYYTPKLYQRNNAWISCNHTLVVCSRSVVALTAIFISLWHTVRFSLDHNLSTWLSKVGHPQCLRMNSLVWYCMSDKNSTLCMLTRKETKKHFAPSMK